MSPRPDVSEERKDQILDAAEEIFAQQGVHESRMDDIVNKSGLSKGSLYRYFKSKDELLIAIFERMFKREFDELEKLSAAEITAKDRLLIITERTIIDVRKMLRLMPLAYEFMSLAFRRKFVQDAFRHYINKYVDIIKPVIQFGLDMGEIHQVDPLDFALAMGAIFEGTILLWVYDKDLVDVERHIRSGMNILIQGIMV